MNETHSPESFDDAYRGIPPWDIGRPQRAVVRLAETGFFRGRVLDIGCGTGDNALFLAAGGLDVTGIDVSRRAIATARAKADEQDLDVRFEVGDALDLDVTPAGFETALDSGVFHVFSDTDRIRYCAALERAVRAGGRLAVICFSENEPGDWGPRRVTQDELRAGFGAGWTIDAITDVRFETLRPDGDVSAWLMTATHR